jgi:small-conductance mechanosensitive channel
MLDQAWTAPLGWTLAIVVVYPLLTLIFAEWSRRVDVGQPALRRSLRAVQSALLPASAIWLVVHKLVEFPPSSLADKLVDTAFGIAILYTLLVFARGVVEILATRTRAPRLLYDIALMILVMIGAAIIISAVWGFSLASLLSAVGVGSVVMGLALQSVIGGMVSGVLLLSARQFALGDYVSADGKTGRVTQIDWRSVTLELSPTEHLVLPSSRLFSGSFTVTDGNQPASFSVKVTIGYEHSPEIARSMLLEAARGVPQLVAPDAAKCRVVKYRGGGIQYSVSILVSDPGKIAMARDELLSRLWYVAQRHDMSIAPDKANSNLARYGQTAEDRANLIAEAGAFRRPAAMLGELAVHGCLERWRGGETILRQGEIADTIWVVLRGPIRVSAQVGPTQVELERMGAGQVFAIREVFRAMPSPVLATAAEDTELLAFPAHAMQRLLDHDPGLASEMETILETRTKALANLRATPEQPPLPGRQARALVA